MHATPCQLPMTYYWPCVQVFNDDTALESPSGDRRRHGVAVLGSHPLMLWKGVGTLVPSSSGGQSSAVDP